MAKYFIEEATLKNMADTIRSLTGNTASMTPSEMTAEVQVAEENVESAMTALETLGVVIPEGSGIGNLADLVGDVEPGLDTSDATALASDILSNKTAYVDGEKITGTIPTKTSSDLTVSGATVNVPAGYYANQATKSVSTATQATPSISINSSGLITASATQSAGYVTSGTKSATKQLTTQAAKTVTPGTTNQTAVASGVYTTGTITVEGDSNLVAENIAEGISIFGISGTYVGSGSGGGDSSSSGSNVIAGLLEGTISEFSSEEVTVVKHYAFFRCNSLTSINLPNCTTIKSMAFASCSKLVSINFPNCETIDNYAFNNCSSLTSINLPKCTSIGNNAFSSCANLTLADFSNCTTIKSMAFASCSKLVSINFPNCEAIDYQAFYNCSSLTSASFLNCITISSGAFRNCTNLMSINLPRCTNMGSGTFSNCSSLTSISLSNCTNIGGSAFYSCFNLTMLSLPVCTSIGSAAFEYCSRLTKLILNYSSVVTLAHINAFYYTPMSNSTYTGSFGSIYVPASLVNSYKSATNWTTYKARITAIT